MPDVANLPYLLRVALPSCLVACLSRLAVVSLAWHHAQSLAKVASLGSRGGKVGQRIEDAGQRMVGQKTEDEGRRMEAEGREATLGREPLSDVFCPLS